MIILKKNVSQLKAGVILSYIQMALGSIISLVYTPVMLRLMGRSEYGLYSISSAVISYLGLLNLGFGSSYIRYYSRYKIKNDEKSIAKLNGLFIIVFSCIGVISFICGLILTQNVRLIFDKGLTDAELDKSKILMVIMSINMSLSFPASVFSSYITAQERFIYQKLLNMINTIINPLVMLPVLMMGYKSIGMVIVSTIISLSVYAINILYCYKKIHISFIFKEVDFRLLKEIASFSIFIAINSVIDQINWSVDKLLLGRFHGTAVTAVYGIAAQLNTIYLSFSTSISNVFTPKVHKMISTGESNFEITKLFTKVGRIQFMVLALVCSGLVLFGKSFIYFWAGADYGDAYYIALLLIIPVTVPLIQNLGIEIQRAKNKHQFRAIIYLIIAALNVVISIPLCKTYGGIGCAIGTALSILVGNGIIMNFFYHEVIKINIIYFWKQIFKLIPSLLIPVVFGIALLRIFEINSVLILAIFILAYTIVYGLSVFLLGMDDTEKKLVIKPFKSILKRKA